MESEKYSWRESLSIGNPDIDDDHKKLIEILNDLITLIEFNKNREEFAFILSRMTDYSLTHFKNEEIYMSEFKYPKLDVHRKLHLNYIYKVSLYNNNLLSENPPDPQEIVDFLTNWWENHIMKIDSIYEDYRKKINSPVKYIKF